MEHFDEIKNNPTYSANSSKHAHGKVWNIFLMFTSLSREKFITNWSTSLKFPVGLSRKF